MNKEKPVVGFMAVGLEPYWGQFAGMREKCEHHHEIMKGKFAPELVQIEDAGIIDSEELARKAGENFAEKRVDIVFCQMLTYAASVYIAPVVRNLDVPVILLNVQYKKSLDYENVKGIGDWLGEGITCAGIPEATAVLKKLGRKYAIITGHMEGDQTVEKEMNLWCSAVRIKKIISTKNLGLFGRSYAGMMDLCVDETEIFKKFGTYIHHLDWQEIIQTGEEVEEERIVRRMEQMKDLFEVNDDISDEDLHYIAQTAEGCFELVERYSLSSCATHYEFDAPKEQRDLVAALNPAMTVLMTEGIAGAPEGDIKAALAMLILKETAGNAMTAELYSMDFNDDTCLIGHSGACDANISKEKAVLKMSGVLHGKKGKGYVAQFYPDPGPVTMLALTDGPDGNYRLVAAEGMGVKGPILELGDTNLRVKFPKPLRAFVNEWSIEGPTHHGVLAKGLHIKALRCIAAVLDIELKIITEETVE